MRLIILTLTLLLTLPFNLQAGTFWVDDNGTASWNNCSGISPLSGASACSMTAANNNLSAGDIVYIRQGEYTTGIAPANSGVVDAEITYSSHSSESVTLTGMYAGINLGAHSYINIKGITVVGATLGLWINGGDYNTVSYSNFENHTGNNWDANLIYNGAEYNHIHHSVFRTNGSCTASGSDDGAVIRIGQEAANDNSRYNLIEDSTFYHGGHHVFGLHGNRNIIRNNYMHNEIWTNGAGNRTLYLLGRDGYTGYNLIEGNRFGYSAAPCDDVIVGNVAISTPYNIFRLNYLYHHNAYGLGFGYYSGYDAGANNRIYNNTFHNSGYNIHPTRVGTSEDAAVTFYYSQVVNNILKNNLYNIQFQNYGANAGAKLSDQKFENEYSNTVNGDPLFLNATATPPGNINDSSLPDFALESSSPAIDAGGNLTFVTSADIGTGTTLLIDDARYFQDGTWARAGLVEADWIAVGATSNYAQIGVINYLTNTITLKTSIQRSAGDPVWLYKNSNGIVSLYGTNPDAGAYEYGHDTIKPSHPTNFRAVVP